MVIYIAIFNISFDIGDKIHLLKMVQITYLKANKALIEVFCNYTDFAEVFLSKLVIKLPKHLKINNYAIELVDDKQLLYGAIYSISLVELKILRTYIKNNLANRFIRLFKSLVRTLILFDKRPDKKL